MSAAPADRAACRVAAALLRQGAALDGFSRVLTLSALLGLLNASLLAVPPLLPALAGVAALLGAAQVWLALRVGFDAELLAWAGGDGGWDALDGAFLALRLVPAEKLGRPTNSRIAGAMRLLRRQAWLVALQALFVAAALVSSLAGQGGAP